MLKNRTFGILAVAAAYLYDILRGAHNGFIYLGSNGVIVALAGVALILLGTFVLMRSAAVAD
jgi:hypothetical protein